jgi:hypothetical protein
MFAMPDNNTGPGSARERSGVGEVRYGNVLLVTYDAAAPLSHDGGIATDHAENPGADSGGDT